MDYQATDWFSLWLKICLAVKFKVWNNPPRVKSCSWMLNLSSLLLCSVHLSNKPRNIYLHLDFWCYIPQMASFFLLSDSSKHHLPIQTFLCWASISSGLTLLALSIFGSLRPHSSNQWLCLSYSWLYKSVEIQSQILQETKNHNAYILPCQRKQCFFLHPKELNLIFRWISLMCLALICMFCFISLVNESNIHLFLFSSEPLSHLSQSVHKRHYIR